MTPTTVEKNLYIFNYKIICMYFQDFREYCKN